MKETPRELGPLLAPDREVSGASTEAQLFPHEALPHLTVDSIYESNHSQEASEGRSEWEDNRNNDRLVAHGLCGDARVFIPKKLARRTASQRTIATGGDQSNFRELLTMRGVSAVVMTGHYNGHLFVPGRRAPGCGGEDEKAEMERKGDAPAPEQTVFRYLKEGVVHHDAVMQAIYAAQEATQVTDDWTAAWALDHRTGNHTVLGYFRYADNGSTSEAGMNAKYFNPRFYDEGALFAQGIPEINTEQWEKMPDILAEYSGDWDSEMAELREQYAAMGVSHEAATERQNPPGIWLSMDPRPLGVIQPGLADVPGAAFRLRIPRVSVDGEATITKKGLEDTLDQLHYPLLKNIHNFRQPGMDFSITNTVIIGTPRMDLSRRIAHAALERPYVQEWLAVPDDPIPNKIITMQVVDGKVQDIEDYYQKAA